MDKFRKKPGVIEAVQITDATFDDPHPNPEHIVGLTYNPRDRNVTIPTLEGVTVGRVGDWIIKGVHGELYPCNPDIFALTYDHVEGGDDRRAIEQAAYDKGYREAMREVAADMRDAERDGYERGRDDGREW